jgi:UDP-N-acetylmuramoylalanine--D-glutamate ligase
VDRVVVEVSSFQLEHLTRPGAFVPRVGVWLNLTPDHLDRHGDMNTYAGMKRRLFEGQGPDDLGVFYLDDPALEEYLVGLPCKRGGFSRFPERLAPGGIRIEGRQLHLPESNRGVTLQLHSPRLAGEHNAENAAAAVLAALELGEDPESIQSGLDSYPGLPHRLEPIRELDGVQYVNDSKGTNVDATAKSLTSFASPIILLAGGRGKGTGYEKLCPLVSKHVKHLILLGEEADRLARDLDGCAPVHRVVSMDEAVLKARSLADPGDVVLLSPACASFDMFKDYAERGRVFANRVRDLGGRS